VKYKVVIGLNTAWNLYNFRAGLISALVERGYEVIAIAPQDEYVDRIKKLGCRFIPLSMDNQGTHPGKDLRLLWNFFILLRKERPDIFLGYTVKPNIYGSLAAQALDIPVINNISGLGSVFINNGFLARIVRNLYRFALLHSAKVFFQNEDDLNLFVSEKLVEKGKVGLLPGSGVNINRFKYSELINKKINTYGENSLRNFQFLLVARLLWDKGVGEFVEAARQLRDRYPSAQFNLLGFVDVQNPAAISHKEVRSWVDEGIVSYLGSTDDIRYYIADADCVVLPSYREGTPRTLLEAAAIGRPIITTDVPGCREVVDNGVNGYLCKVRDSLDLADKMECMIMQTHEQCIEMGRQGRKKAEQQFDERIVVQEYLDIIKNKIGANICAD